MGGEAEIRVTCLDVLHGMLDLVFLIAD